MRNAIIKAMEKELQQKIEQLNCIRNEMTHLWGSVFLLGGGSISLMLQYPSFKGYLLAAAGIITALILTYAYFIRREETIKIVNKLKGKE